jgi:hypothetical protein
LTSGFGREQEHIPPFLGVVEAINRVLSVHGLDVACDLLESDALDLEVVF